MFQSNFLILSLVVSIGLLLLLLPSTNGANILGVFTSSSVSHVIIHMSAMKALAERGHNITVITTTKPKVTHKDIHHIYIPIAEKYEKSLEEFMKKVSSEKGNIFKTMKAILSQTALIDLQYDALKDPKISELYGTKFDLLVMGYFMNDFQLGLGAKFKCPMVMIWTSNPNSMVSGMIGSPTMASFVPLHLAPSGENGAMTFAERTQNYIFRWVFRGVEAALEAYMQHLYSDVFGQDPTMPPLKEMRQNVSILFTNSHSNSEGPIQPKVPGLIEIGGIQIKDTPDPLPKDLAEFLESGKDDGVILFSLGTNVQSSAMKPEIIRTVFNVLSSLKQKVIWKWEDPERTPGKASNILFKKWMPQDDILAHPNLKLFITHAGKGGVAEAQYHAVPMVALPIFADQHANANNMVKAGYGLTLETTTLQEKELEATILEVLSNPKYSRAVKIFSDLYRDRPMTAKQEVIYWTEYVLRYHGAKHIQSPLVYLNYFQSESWDVIAFLVIVFYLAFKIIKLILRFIIRKIFFRSTIKTKRD